MRQGQGLFEVCLNGQWTTMSSLSTSGATSSCATLLAATPTLPSGVYSLSANGYVFQAQCDMTGGGWTMIQAHTSTSRTIQSLRVLAGSGTYLPEGAVKALAAVATQVRFVDGATNSTATSNVGGDAIADLRKLDAINIADQSLWTFTGSLTAANFTNACGTALIYPQAVHTCGSTTGAHIGNDAHNLFASTGLAGVTVWVH